MQQFHEQIFSAMITTGALRFGNFTLKSGRRSPYFFNSGDLLAQASNLELVASAMAARVAKLVKQGKCDCLFGPAYKGIAIAAATAAMLRHEHQLDLPWGYNRKETKDHGEGGQLIGTQPAGKVLLLDDVLTSGMAVQQAIHLIRQNKATPSALLLIMDRQEAGPGGKPAHQELATTCALLVEALFTLKDLVLWLESKADMQGEAQALRSYAEGNYSP